MCPHKPSANLQQSNETSQQRKSMATKQATNEKSKVSSAERMYTRNMDTNVIGRQLLWYILAIEMVLLP